MKFIADLHIHSHYSRATSKELDPVHLEYWGKIKGVNVIGTGDFTHPKWTEELKQALEPAEPGLFKLKKDLTLPNPVANPDKPVRFLLSAEISNIYKKNGKVRKIHNVILAPDFETVEKIQKRLQRLNFNITSDGRPILGMDARDLLELVLEIDERIFFIPAHIWTPWFAVLGSKSGFDSIDECFEDLTRYIYAVETGLSSDQPLNWLCSFLDKFNLVSNSDAHSPEKLGRNANIFDTDLSYDSIIQAMKDQQSNALQATVDLYPQEGKYHYDGHRKCGVRFDPVQTLEHNGICPVCGKPLTLGVAHRIATLADRDDPLLRPNRKQFHYIIPLKEILSEIMQTGAASKKVDKQYLKLIAELGDEFHILLQADLEQIQKSGGPLLSEAIRRMRAGQVIIEEGFDGQYGTIKLFDKDELKAFGTSKLFVAKPKTQYSQRPLLNFDVRRFRELKQQLQQNQANAEQPPETPSQQTLNQQQQQAIEHQEGPALILSGPGTGKTRVLTLRIARLVNDLQIPPQNILAITFTRQAAAEMRKRLENLLSDKAKDLTITTFHALGLDILRQATDQEPMIIDSSDQQVILKDLGVPKNKIQSTLRKISIAKNQLTDVNDLDPELKLIFEKYNQRLQQLNLVDFDDLIYKTVNLLKNNPQLQEQLQQKFQWILIDEFQDINPAQYELIKLLSPAQANIFAIGDPNQAIYGFRGSSNSLIQRFIQEFNPKVYKITTSYRVPQSILSASADVLHQQEALTGISPGVKIVISPQATDKSEAEFIARQIEDLIGGVGFFSIDSKVTEGQTSKIQSLSDIAILVRTRQLFPTLEKALKDHNIPYQVIGTEPFFTLPPYDQLLDALKYLVSPDNPLLKQKVANFVHVFEHIDTDAPVKDLILSLAKTLNLLDDKVELLAEMAQDFGKDKVKFLQFLQTSYGQDEYNPQLERVALMTLHAAKGLEFSCVFIAAVEDGIIPYTIYKSEVDIEEERRLLYVGMTRAKQCLYMTHARTRRLFNRQWQLKPSRFLSDIKRELIEKKTQQFKPKPQDKQLKLFG